MLKEDLFWTFDINKEYIWVHVSLSKVKTLESYLLKLTSLTWWSWVIGYPSRITSVICSHSELEFSCSSYSLLSSCYALMELSCQKTWEAYIISFSENRIK